MAREIERKFLIADQRWRDEAVGSVAIRQFYLARTGRVSVRVRIIDAVEARLTVKSAVPGMIRDEFDYAIPVADAVAMEALRSGSVIEKTRYRLPCTAGVLTVDVFGGDNAGLLIAELELADDAPEVALPDWLGREVTGDARFYNADLSERPFAGWSAAEKAAAAAPTG
ncbi:CYTH domain-containing protein [Tepidamorphus gemmatus]|jgi:adenylate cyclase|uniref:CYTH domain-containing protein n=1 Tax=Tepidamorphus gemmatus TaxID=747076 RepID=A0A4R3MHU2_9HYPH|nr:CYTH domain-containing protein [Tepidamorphus gemmatus]TCT13192.1 CYTH domain-containing protein [Tepidamorphus gemmatus]